MDRGLRGLLLLFGNRQLLCEYRDVAGSPPQKTLGSNGPRGIEHRRHEFGERIPRVWSVIASSNSLFVRFYFPVRGSEPGRSGT
jgi:hypothetical protein